jgi:putative ABC transport system substrate-binding protein
VNNRRKVVIALGAGVLTIPFASFAQQPGKVWRVGFLLARHVDFLDSDYSFGPFMRGVRELGYVDGKNIAIEWRSSEGKTERLPGLAAELVQLKVDVIVTGATPATIAAQKSTNTIPIVMVNASDPVGQGFVKSLAHPGGNITGISNVSFEVVPKQMEILRDMVPQLSIVAILLNPANSSHTAALKNAQAAAQRVSLKIVPVEARNPQEIANVFSEMDKKKAGAVIVAQDPFFNQQARQMAELAVKYRLPSIGGLWEYADAGGLMSYGSNIANGYLRSAAYVDKILKGAKPADLPVEQPTIFELFINSKTAKALGLKIPNSILVQATKVIE